MRPDSHTQLVHHMSVSFFLPSYFGDVAFSEYYVPLLFSLSFCMETTLYVFLPGDVFIPCDHGLGFDISLLCENSILKNVLKCYYSRNFVYWKYANNT